MVLQNFLSVAPKFYKSCLTLLNFSKVFLRRRLLSKRKRQVQLPFLFFKTSAAGEVRKCNLKLPPSLRFLGTATTAGHVQMYN